MNHYDTQTERVYLGQPATVGELRKLLSAFTDDTALAHRNAPLPSFWFWNCHDYVARYIEFTAEVGTGGGQCHRLDRTKEVSSE